MSSPLPTSPGLFDSLCHHLASSLFPWLGTLLEVLSLAVVAGCVVQIVVSNHVYARMYLPLPGEAEI